MAHVRCHHHLLLLLSCSHFPLSCASASADTLCSVGGCFWLLVGLWQEQAWRAQKWAYAKIAPSMHRSCHSRLHQGCFIPAEGWRRAEAGGLDGDDVMDLTCGGVVIDRFVAPCTLLPALAMHRSSLQPRPTCPHLPPASNVFWGLYCYD